jgi:hypothetical protein
LQPQSLPQVHSFLSFIGQFLPLFLQLTFSPAKEVMQIIAARTENRIIFIDCILSPESLDTKQINLARGQDFAEEDELK